MPRTSSAANDLNGRERAGMGARLARLLFSLVAIAWLGSLAAVLGFSEYDGARRSDAIVVLGAAQYAGRPSPVLRARIDHALDLWRRGTAPMLVFTGGVGTGDTTSEAAVSAAYARKQGIPESAMMLESSGRTTSASIRSVASMLGARNETSVVLVSDPFHMFRLWILARRHGLVARTSPTRSSPLQGSAQATLGYIFSESLKAPVAFLTE